MYYLACGQHLGWGYVDHPPGMPFVAWLFEYDKLRGRMASHLGDVFVEYGRASAPGEKACG